MKNQNGKEFPRLFLLTVRNIQGCRVPGCQCDIERHFWHDDGFYYSDKALSMYLISYLCLNFLEHPCSEETHTAHRIPFIFPRERAESMYQPNRRHLKSSDLTQWDEWTQHHNVRKPFCCVPGHLWVPERLSHREVTLYQGPDRANPEKPVPSLSEQQYFQNIHPFLYFITRQGAPALSPKGVTTSAQVSGAVAARNMSFGD